MSKKENGTSIAFNMRVIAWSLKLK